MKIGIDLKPFFSGSKYRGIGMYSREFIKELTALAKDSEFHFLNLYEPYCGDPILENNCFLHEYHTGPQIVDSGTRQLFHDYSVSKVVEYQVRHFIEKSEIEVMIFTSITEYGNLFKKHWFDGVFKVGILYDLIPLIFPEQCLCDEAIRADYESSLEFLREMDLLFAISESAKEDAVKLLNIPEEKIIVIYAGIGEEFKKIERPDIKSIKKKYGIKDEFIIFAGGIDFKKNIFGLIRAYSNLELKLKKKYQLVIVGNMPADLRERIMQFSIECKIPGRVICTGYVPIGDLVTLYNVSELLAFPSLYEGFGLPIIEAMACGTCVLTSNCSSLKEVARDYATLVDPTSVKSIEKGLRNVLIRKREAKILAEKAISYALSYTWKRVAETALTAIKNYNIRREISPYNFVITQEMLCNIAKLYRKKRLQFLTQDMRNIAQCLLKVQNHTNNYVISGKQHILYDVTVAKDWIKAGYITGIGRVCNELLNALRKIAWVTPVIVHPNEKSFVCTMVDITNWSDTGIVVELNEKNIFLMPEFQIRGVQVAENHPYAGMLRRMNIRCYAILYDILPILWPEYFEKKTSENFSRYFQELLENYTGILTDSKAVADEVIALYREEYCNTLQYPLQIGYFHLGKNTFESVDNTSVGLTLRKFFENSSKVYLMVGTIEPRKGHYFVLSCFEKLWKNGFDGKLCILGHVGWNMDEFVNDLYENSQYGKKIILVKDATDSELAFAYEQSFVLIQASIGEGFGLPLIEAGHYNLPILCSDIPVFHEVAANNAMYFDRSNEKSLQDAILEIGKKIRGNTVPESKNIKAMSWDESASKVFSMISENENWYTTLYSNGSVNMGE